MKYFTSLIPFVAGWALLMLTNSFASIGLTNGILQLVLFTFVVCIPIWMTGRMSYVDIGWPLGLTGIGGLTWMYSEGESLRVAVMSLVFLFAGSRMELGALKLWSEGRLKQDFHRNEYQKQRWIVDGKTNTALAMQVDALWQGLANASFLAMPPFVIAANPSEQIHAMEIIGLLIWTGAFAMESVADIQKLTFLKK
jgi:steroid 5-alpha reductase family enzyme